VINYYRFCCRIRIADEYADEVPGGEFLAVENGDAKDRREQFREARINEISDWFRETPALLAHIRALQAGDTRPVKSRLVDTEAACLYTGRSRQDLYGLRARGMLTAHWGNWGSGPRRAWDVLELDTVKRVTPG
jgi:hypothetical protein